ncbi:MAG TPA: hypothetical protein VG672_04405 [Bryobacteraceae bacterium]|nr:hypothetical protein [Bryobacteraceae bacterium]
MPAPAWAQNAEAPHQLNLVIVESEGAINNIRQRTSREAIIQVEDENHKPVAGAAVTFLLPTDGPGGTFNGSRSLTVMTDSQGRAVARGFQPNNAVGKFQIQVKASFQGLTGSTVINQSNVLPAAAAAAGGIGVGKILAIIAIAGAAAAGGAVAATRGGGGNNTPARPAAVITAGTAVVGAP